MPKYIVYLLQPIATWENVVAESAEQAQDNCLEEAMLEGWLDGQLPYRMIAQHSDGFVDEDTEDGE